MIRVGNLWDRFCNIENATNAIYLGTVNKRGDRVVRRRIGYTDSSPEHLGKLDPEKVKEIAERLTESLEDGQWKPAAMKHLHVERPGMKPREIDCPSLMDHFVMWMLMLTMQNAIMRGMYEYSCGSIPGRGINFARKTIEKWVQNDKASTYFVKLDIRKFYASIDTHRLKTAIRRIIKDKRILHITDTVIDMTQQGVPIGSYTSQWFANFFLQPLDHHIKQDLYKTRRGKRTNYVRHYLRYMDDILLIGTSERDLKKAVSEIIRYCRETLGLEIKPCWEIKRIDDMPIDIVGYRFYRDHTEVRKSIFLSTKRLASHMGKKLKEQNCISIKNAQTLVSLYGWIKHADNKQFTKKYIRPAISMKLCEEAISYASKNGTIGNPAAVYYRTRK